MKRILITGAAGFIGSHVAEKLLARGDHVWGQDNFDPYYDPEVKRANIAPALAHPHYRFDECDIRSREDLWRAFEEIEPEVVVHLAAQTGVRDSLEQPNLHHEVNVIGTQHVLDACVEFKPEHLVAASSSSVYSGCTEIPFTEDNPVMNPISPYAATKRMNELMAHVCHHIYGLRITMLRFFTVYGPRQRPDMAIHKFTRLIDEGLPVPMYGAGDTLRDYTYIDDIVQGVLQSVDRPFDFEIINLGKQQTTSLRMLIDMIATQLGKEAVIDEMPLQPGDALVTNADISKARRLLDYDPSFAVDEGIARFIEWYREMKAQQAA